MEPLELSIELNEKLIERLSNGEQLRFETMDKDVILVQGVKITKETKKSADIVDND